MEVYVKESLYVLDYDNNIKDAIFLSNDNRSQGYAYNISITESNTGYSDLTFDMPNYITDAEGNQLKNPKLRLLTPLVKLRYNRRIYYTGEKTIVVKEPSGYGDNVSYVDKEYSNVYPNNIIEDYTMDYIVQPVDKKRDNLKITTSFTAIDYPRFNLSKKKVGLNINNDIITKEEWSLFKNKPIDNPGTIKYIQWNSELSKTADNIDIPLEWDPENASSYPLSKENIIKLMENTAEWPYGYLATAFYWPIVSTARYEGIMYKEGGFLVLQLYDFYNLTTEGIDPDHLIDRYSWEWTQLYKVSSYLCPNNADNYLHYILDGTNWKVAQRINEKGELEDDVDIVKVEISNPSGSTTSTTTADNTCNISVSGSNCYNAITAVCQGLQLYPIFNCIDRTVSLRTFAGKNYGLTYSLGRNISSNNVKNDGEKVITKLYVTGGKDYNGDSNINIGPAERSYVKRFNGFYNSVADLPTENVEGYWAIVDPDIPEENFIDTKYNENMEEYDDEVHDLLVKEYWKAGDNRKVYFWNESSWELGNKEDNGNWSYTINGKEYIIDPITGTQTPWDPNDDMYIFSRSPYGTNYILNLKWAYQNEWITREQILELYQYELKIHNLDYAFMDKYKKDLVLTQQNYYDATNEYDISQEAYQSTLYDMENKYYNVEGQYSKGTVHCFHKAPLGTYKKYNATLKKDTHYIKLFHCYDCTQGTKEATKPIAPIYNEQTLEYEEGADITICPICGSSNVTNDEIYIPVYDDYEDTLQVNDSNYPYGTDVTRTYEGYRYNPHLKGYFQRLCMSLDKANGDWDIGEYEKRISMIETIPYRQDESTIDSYNYIIDGVYVRSTSGQIEVWNKKVDYTNTDSYIYNYGKMLNDLRTVNDCLEKIKELQLLHERFDEKQDYYHALIQEKFGDYIVEGNYTNDEQPYEGLLFKEGIEASDKYSTPEITYDLKVIDSSGLVEYRQPNVTKYVCSNCNYETTKAITKCIKCNSDDILIENNIFNDLVRSLHSVGQIIPKAGDYVTIYDEPIGMYGIPGLITEIKRVLDNPVQNSIQLDTSYTDDEELVGNIITATNTVLNNTDIYARTAILKTDGTIDSNSIQQSLDNVNANITIVGTNGNILLNGAGLRCTDPSNSQKAMKYTGTGIFKTTNLDNSGEATTWEKMMTPDGINATYINSGSIDTNKLTIMSGLSGKVIIDQYGLAVKNQATKSSHITNFNVSEAKNNSSYASQWGINNNIKTFVGVDNNNEGLVYTKGFLVAEEGSNIAGWITDNNSFYHLNGSSKDLWLSPGGVNGTVNNHTNNFAYYVNGNFGVTTKGQLYSKDANIQGHIEAYDGKIGQFALNQTKLYSGSGSNQAGMGVFGNEWAFWAGSETSSSAPFRVGHNGSLVATSANISGTITATSGTIGGCSISNGTLYISNGNISGRINADHLDARTITTDNLSTQTINCNQLSGGKIEGQTISGGTIEGTTITGANLNGSTLNIKDGNNWKFRIGVKGGLYCNGYDTTYDTTTFAISADGNMHVGRKDGNSTFKLYTNGYDVDYARLRKGNGITMAVRPNSTQVMRFINGIFVGTGDW